MCLIMIIQLKPLIFQILEEIKAVIYDDIILGRKVRQYFAKMLKPSRWNDVIKEAL